MEKFLSLLYNGAWRKGANVTQPTKFLIYIATRVANKSVMKTRMLTEQPTHSNVMLIVVVIQQM